MSERSAQIVRTARETLRRHVQLRRLAANAVDRSMLIEGKQVVGPDSTHRSTRGKKVTEASSASAETERFEMLKQLDDLGYSFLDLQALGTSAVRYADAVPTLARWLLESEFWENKIALVRVLEKRWAKAALPALVTTFASEIPTEIDAMSTRWAVGSAIEKAYDDSVLFDVVSLAKERSYGMSRQMLALALGKSRRPEALDALLSLADDASVDGHVLEALAKQPKEAARPVFEQKVDDDRAWVRQKARRALLKLSSTDWKVTL